VEAKPRGMHSLLLVVNHVKRGLGFTLFECGATGRIIAYATNPVYNCFDWRLSSSSLTHTTANMNPQCDTPSGRVSFLVVIEAERCFSSPALKVAKTDIQLSSHAAAFSRADSRRCSNKCL